MFDLYWINKMKFLRTYVQYILGFGCNQDRRSGRKIFDIGARSEQDSTLKIWLLTTSQKSPKFSFHYSFCKGRSKHLFDVILSSHMVHIWSKIMNVKKTIWKRWEDAFLVKILEPCYSKSSKLFNPRSMSVTYFSKTRKNLPWSK